jgi:predicted nucleic acid-binding Zn ribbon protein
VEEIGKILPAVVNRHVRQSEPALLELLASLWPRLVGKAIARQSRPVAFEAGTLQVVTSCPTWAAQLQQLAEEIRAEINSHLGAPVVKKLRVRYDPGSGGTDTPAPAHASHAAPEIAAGRISDSTARLEPELSGVLQRSFAKYFSRRARKVH